MVVVKVLPDVGGEGLVDKRNETPAPKKQKYREKRKREKQGKERERERENMLKHEERYC